MMRSLSSCLDVTRMWRRTDRASLEKKPSTRLSHEPCFGVKGNSNEEDGSEGLVDRRLPQPSPKPVPAPDARWMLELYGGVYRGSTIRPVPTGLIRPETSASCGPVATPPG